MSAFRRSAICLACIGLVACGPVFSVQPRPTPYGNLTVRLEPGQLTPLPRDSVLIEFPVTADSVDLLQTCFFTDLDERRRGTVVETLRRLGVEVLPTDVPRVRRDATAMVPKPIARGWEAIPLRLESEVLAELGDQWLVVGRRDGAQDEPGDCRTIRWSSMAVFSLDVQEESQGKSLVGGLGLGVAAALIAITFLEES